MDESNLIALAKTVVEKFNKNNLTLSVAESCTGGWLSKIITEVSGASSIYMGGVCSYSNNVKSHVLGVNEKTLEGTGLEVTHINILDNTVEGVCSEKDKVFSVQYHPESAPGPQDSAYLFDQFISLMQNK